MMAALHFTAHAHIDICTQHLYFDLHVAWLEILIIEGSDNRGSDNLGWTVAGFRWGGEVGARLGSFPTLFGFFLLPLTDYKQEEP